MSNNQEKAGLACRQLARSSPHAHAALVLYLQELQSAADEILRSATGETLLRQNQGKAQLCMELLKILNT